MENSAQDVGAARTVEKVLDRLLSVLAGASVMLLLGLVVFIVIARNVFGIGLPWLDELARYLQVWLIYTGAIVLVLRDDHITMDAVYRRLPARGRAGLRGVTGVTYLLVCGLATYLSYEQAHSIWRSGETSPSGSLPAVLGYSALPVSFALMFLASAYFLIFRAKDEPEEQPSAV